MNQIVNFLLYKGTEIRFITSFKIALTADRGIIDKRNGIMYHFPSQLKNMSSKNGLSKNLIFISNERQKQFV